MMYGKKIKELREKCSLSQQELADKIGLERACLSLLENDKRELKADELKAIAKIFDVSPALFFDEDAMIKTNIWRSPSPCSELEDYKQYLVRWESCFGKMSSPIIAFWISSEKAFFPRDGF